MPSENKQLNIRVDPETEALLPLVMEAASAATGLRVSQSDAVRLGLRELARKYDVPLPLPAAGPGDGKKGAAR